MNMTASELFLGKDSTTQSKGVAILFVILGHLAGTGRLRLPGFELAGGWGVTIFLVLSGLGLYRSHLAHGIDDFFRRRLSTVLVPYTLVTAFCLLVDGFARDQTYPMRTVIAALVGLDLSSAIDPTMWFVSFLILWYVGFFVSFRFIADDRGRVAALFLLGMVLFAARGVLPSQTGARLHVFDFPFGVALGMASAYWPALARRETIVRLAGSATALSAVVALLTVSRMNDGWPFYVAANCAVAAMTICAIEVAWHHRRRSRILIFAGTYAYGVYLLEGVLLFKYKVLPFEDGWSWLAEVALIFGLSFVLMRLTARLTRTLALR